MKISIINKHRIMALASLAGLGLPLHAQQAAAPVKRAVVVGVDLYQDTASFLPLRGCGNDADSIVALLQSRFGFKAEEIILLKNQEVTLEALRKTLQKNLVDELPADGVGVFYYAGHGLGIPDQNGDEADGLDEALVLHDTSKTNLGSYLVDDEIQVLLEAVKTPNLLMLLDTCHSGTANRTASPYAEFRTVPMQWQTSRSATRSGNQEFMIRSTKGHVVLSACQSKQEANELVGEDFTAIGEAPASVPCGLFTWAVRKWLADDANTQASLGQAVTGLEKLMAKAITDTGKTNPQQPWFDLSGREAVSLATLLAGKAVAPAVAATSPTATPTTPPVTETITFTADGVALGGKIPLEMKVNKKIFKEGEKLLLEVKAEEDCYARLYYMNVEGKVTQLFPNEHHQDNFLPKGRVVNIPGAAWGFDLEMSAPYGMEALKLVASNTQFTDLQDAKWADGLFQQVNITTLQEMSTRGINAKEGDSRYGHATVFYEVLDPKAPVPAAAPTTETSTAPPNTAPTPPGQPEPPTSPTTPPQP
jgi:hypothetical protein